MGKSKKEFVPRGAADAKAEDLKNKFYGATVNLTIKEVRVFGWCGNCGCE